MLDVKGGVFKAAIYTRNRNHITEKIHELVSYDTSDAALLTLHADEVLLRKKKKKTISQVYVKAFTNTRSEMCMKREALDQTSQICSWSDSLLVVDRMFFFFQEFHS